MFVETVFFKSRRLVSPMYDCLKQRLHCTMEMTFLELQLM